MKKPTKRGPGRPISKSVVKRNYINGRARGVKPVSFRVSAEERALIDSRAAAAGVAASEYARRKTLASDENEKGE